MPRLNQQFKLSDGRRLGYDEYGPADGQPLFYFHGSPSSRLEFKLFGSEDLLRSLNGRLIAVDRPGMGLSDFQPGRCLLDWPKDVTALADHLKIDQFAVLAYSLGGPYGAACAFAIPKRLSRVGIVSGSGPYQEPGLADELNIETRRYLHLSHEKPWLSRLLLGYVGLMTRLAPTQFVAGAARDLPEPDRQTVLQPEFQKGFLAMVQESLRQGARGGQHDTLLAITEWGFRPQDIQMPVQLWHGEADKNAPIAIGRYLADAIPQCQARFYPGEGHISLFKQHAQEIIRILVD